MRKLTWRVDTLYTAGAQTILTDVWGSSSANVIALGWMSGRHIVYRYNSTTWTQEPIPPPPAPEDRQTVSPNAILGFSPNDIWIVGIVGGWSGDTATNGTYLARYNGSQWQRWPSPPGMIKWPPGFGFQSIGGTSGSDIWAAGMNIVAHWNGIEWREVQVPLYPEGMQFLSIAALASNNVYMTGFRNDVTQPHDTTAYFLYHYNGVSWTVEDSVILTVFSSTQSFGSQLKGIGTSLFSANNGLWRKAGNSWVKLRDREVFRVAGTSEENILSIDSGGKVYHYNGIDWYQLRQFENPDSELRGIWTDGNEVFIVGFIQGGLKGIVWHGK
ncbi:MAG TPA: hypothetical protein VNN76_03920 [Bacteroidota bacterium]|nr:hypothetical protein [Bacteroidota bacterium]